jgi:FKBP-type peptidyl-prolyl cis-trans isomerase FkpA
MNGLRFPSRAAAGALLGLLAACGGKPPAADPSDSAAPALAAPAVAALEIVELQPGSGAPITAGQNAVVQYTGWLYETSASDKKGKEFDSSRNSGQPFSFVVGAGKVIKGWDQGVLGMREGEKRKLVIPPSLAYGPSGRPGIPPDSTLVFEVELLAINPKGLPE